MTKRSILTVLLTVIFACSNAQPLEGFLYGNDTAPVGDEWQNPEKLAYNKLQPRAWFASFANKEEARLLLPENSSFRQSLNGTWKFHFAKNPDERPADFFMQNYDCSAWNDIQVPSSWNMVGVQKDGSLKYGVPIYVNQPVIFYHQVKPGDWKEGVMREPPHDWTTYEYRNEVGSFRRTFNVPKEWKGRELYIEFDGVDSFFYLWVNGQYVGFAKNSRDVARFDITKYTRAGKNTVAVEVYRNSDGSFLEAQDMFRLPGIFREVAVYSTPKVHIQDLIVNAGWDGKQGTLDITSNVEDFKGKNAKGYSIEYTLYENELYGDNNKPVFTTRDPDSYIVSNEGSLYNITCPSLDVKPWTAEEPNVYVLVATLKDKKGREVESVAAQVGFRTVEIKDTKAEDDEFGLAGRYFYVNGKPVKLKGVNRHETNPERGHAITREQMEEEIMMMKRANINHVRTSHYSCDPYFYYLCNKYGIYLEGEANVESHEYYYGEASISHPIEWRAAHVARMMEQAHARVNDPCIVIWSLGNEAGPGDNFKASYEAVKEFDPTRPVQYERNNDIVDMGSNQYPSIAWVRSAVKGNMNIKYPFHISEYAHSMGNAVGNLVDYWDAMESTNFFCGGAIWDWIDQSMYNYTKDGVRYLAYGGDFGDRPNDREFVMNGIIFGDMEPKPQYYEVKKVYQYVGVTWENKDEGTIRVFNKNYYTDDLNDYYVNYIVMKDGEPILSDDLEVGAVAPRSTKVVTIPGLKDIATKLAQHEGDEGSDYYFNIYFRLKTDKPWARAGYIQAEEQLALATEWDKLNPLDVNLNNKINLQNPSEDSNELLVSGEGFNIRFDVGTGVISSLTYNGQQYITDGNGPRLDAFRAPVNNDNWGRSSWYDNGLDRLDQKVLLWKANRNNDGTVSLLFTTESQAPGKDFKFTANTVYTILQDGSITLQTAVTSNKPSLVLPRLGFAMLLDGNLDQLNYYGRGPVENYPDRKTSQFVGIYSSTVDKEFANFPKPQDVGNHIDTRWLLTADKAGNGMLFIADDSFSFSALPYSAQQMAEAPHPHELQRTGHTYLHIDTGITGLGGNSCGQGPPLEQDRVKATPHLFGFMIRPFNKSTMTLKDQIAAPEGEAPLAIQRDNEGNVTVTSRQLQGGGTQEIMYSVNNGREKKWEGSLNMREGGTIVVYDKRTPWMKFTQTFERIEQIPVTVVYASSVESGEGDAEHLTDGNPNTYWHTMWSVTVAMYPHWVDFDCGALKTLKGFTYLPRQDSRNGNIKGYRIQTSIDGKTWSDPVCEGTFENNQNLKRVLFPQAVKARYLRFTALSSQDGQDFATGAEFGILEQ